MLVSWARLHLAGCTHPHGCACMLQLANTRSNERTRARARRRTFLDVWICRTVLRLCMAYWRMHSHTHAERTRTKAANLRAGFNSSQPIKLRLCVRAICMCNLCAFVMSRSFTTISFIIHDTIFLYGIFHLSSPFNSELRTRFINS